MVCITARIGSGVVLFFAIFSQVANAGLTFNFINQGGASAQMMAGFTDAGALWSSRFNDPIILNVRVNASALGAGIIAHTDSFYDPYVYSNVRNAFVADRISPDDFSGVSHLQAGPNFSMLINRTGNNPAGVVSSTPYFDTGLGGAGQAGPENNNTIRMTYANARALGLVSASDSNLDGIITFSNAVSFDYNRGDGINASQIDFVGVAAHEIAHLMGFVSGVDVLAGNAVAPGMNDNQLKFVTPLDLFRFSSRSVGAGGGDGVIDWTADSATKYFSLNGGATPIAEFSTGATYEESHWKNGAGLGIMNPTAGLGQLLSVSANDVRAFDAIGYNVVPAPEPAAELLLAAIGLLFSSRRRARTSAL